VEEIELDPRETLAIVAAAFSLRCNSLRDSSVARTSCPLGPADVSPAVAKAISSRCARLIDDQLSISGKDMPGNFHSGSREQWNELVVFHSYTRSG